jgi:argininosuccinate lyase
MAVMEVLVVVLAAIVHLLMLIQNIALVYIQDAQIHTEVVMETMALVVNALAILVGII